MASEVEAWGSLLGMARVSRVQGLGLLGFNGLGGMRALGFRVSRIQDFKRHFKCSEVFVGCLRSEVLHSAGKVWNFSEFQ